MAHVDLMRGKDHFLCCICFDVVLYEEAYEAPDGQRWDMCPKCGAMEAVAERRLTEERET